MLDVIYWIHSPPDREQEMVRWSWGARLATLLVLVPLAAGACSSGGASPVQQQGGTITFGQDQAANWLPASGLPLWPESRLQANY
jgi:hypothetical protein